MTLTFSVSDLNYLKKKIAEVSSSSSRSAECHSLARTDFLKEVEKAHTLTRRGELEA